MAYRIVYGPEKKKTRKKWKLWIAAGLTALALLGRQRGWGRYLIPGDAAVTASSAQKLVAGIAAGEPVREAFADFCREILDHGQVY